MRGSGPTRGLHQRTDIRMPPIPDPHAEGATRPRRRTGAIPGVRVLRVLSAPPRAEDDRAHGRFPGEEDDYRQETSTARRTAADAPRQRSGRDRQRRRHDRGPRRAAAQLALVQRPAPDVGTASCKFGHARILLEAVSASRWTTAARSTSARATSRTSTRPRRLGVGDQVVRAIDWATTSFIEEYAKPLPVSASS
jgi:hypothetical protein